MISWPKEKLDKICRPKQWPTIPTSVMVKDGYPVYGANGKIGFYTEYTHERPTLLITCRGATCGTLNISEPFSYVTGNAMALDELDEDRVDQKFLFYALNQRGLNDVITGSAQPQITRQSLSSVEIPLPPLEEQRRIAAILDKADAIRRKRQESIRLTEEFLRSTFLEMFGDPVTNPKGWGIEKLGNVISSIDSGWSANGTDRSKKPDEWAVLKISAVTSGRFISSEYKALDEEIPSGRKIIVPKRGDLLFSRANTRELVAATCLVENDQDKLFIPDKLWRVIPKQDLCTSEYLRYLLAHNKFREQITKKATGTSGSMLNVSMEKVREEPAPIPPISLQNKFAQILWKCFDSRNRIEHSNMNSIDLFNSLTHRAFRGEL